MIINNKNYFCCSEFYIRLCIRYENAFTIMIKINTDLCHLKRGMLRKIAEKKGVAKRQCFSSGGEKCPIRSVNTT